ncbi:PAS domain S-box-containing protein [Desulfocicer vacuolatum DSM 3385]|uniref:histidine kinase n=1 Tax=Desulfocicer vacuolatum DSM 3385 TaxID=1121400 RepID=A0A1W2ERN1_9BACT|nr:ATP-binding protein [Desulfocicer vacuolatum]SMD12380.1 PAS domain S-box-containing protein [Desulfocicer vacuolatum DSM 3385]
MEYKELARQLKQEKAICNKLRSELDEVHQELYKTNSELMQLTLELDERVAKRTHELQKSEQKLREHRDCLQEMVKIRTESLEMANASLARNMKALEASEKQFCSLVATIPDIVYRIDSKGRFTFINDAVKKLGYTPDELMGKHFRTIIVPRYEKEISLNKILNDSHRLKKQKKPIKLFDERRTGKRKTTGLEIKLLCRDSSRLYYGHLKKLNSDDVIVEINSTGLYTQDDETSTTLYIGTMGIIRDISERKSLENDLRKARDDLEIKVDQRTRALVQKNKEYTEELIKSQLLEKKLIQAQKMEAVGTLAGGIAHDFNNILSIILGFVELSFDHAAENKELAENLTEINVAGNRAKELIKQILTFARKSDEKIEPLRASLIAKEVLKLLRSTIPSSISIVNEVKSNGQIMANPTQLHQIFMNLATNAAHAMQHMDEGTLKISMQDMDIDKNNTPAGIPHIAHGKYVVIKISDTGKGIPQKNLDLIFEPYFTTKPPGEGTGLGLSVVHGIIKNCNGEICVTSNPETGTKFTIFFPAVTHRVKRIKNNEKTLPTGTERIFVVDDEPMIAKLISRILEQCGYTVISTNSSLDALEMIRKTPEAFDLVITDMTMPHMTGERLAPQILNIRPDLPIIICTGYSSRINENTIEKTGARALLMKPVNRKKLSTMVRAILDGHTFHGREP